MFFPFFSLAVQLMTIAFIFANIVVWQLSRQWQTRSKVYGWGFGIIVFYWLVNISNYQGLCGQSVGGGGWLLYPPTVPCSFWDYLNFIGLPIVGILSIPLVIWLLWQWLSTRRGRQ
jgi:hypothetical protein